MCFELQLGGEFITIGMPFGNAGSVTLVSRVVWGVAVFDQPCEIRLLVLLSLAADQFDFFGWWLRRLEITVQDRSLVGVLDPLVGLEARIRPQAIARLGLTTRERRS